MASSSEVGGFKDTELTSLKSRFDGLRQDFFDATQRETGFVVRDCIDLLEASSTVITKWQPKSPSQPAVSSTLPDRDLSLVGVPFGGVAVVLPRNACLYLGILSTLAALSAGNKVWLKCPSACSETGNLLSQLFQGLPVEVSSRNGREFMSWAVDSPDIHLVHFIGESTTGASYFEPLFQAGKHFLLDGNGNAYAYVHHDGEVETAASELAQSITRFNGQTCTAVKGIVAHPDCYVALTDAVVEHLEHLNVGDATDPATEVSALFDVSGAQAVETLVRDSNSSLLTGQVKQNGLIAPILATGAEPTCQLVREGSFAPVAWIKQGDFEAFRTAWNNNRYPLCASLFTRDEGIVTQFASLPRLSRLTLNGDSTLEDPLEPWGALPPSGNGKVEAWTARYSRTVQIDRPVTSLYSQRR